MRRLTAHRGWVISLFDTPGGRAVGFPFEFRIRPRSGRVPPKGRRAMRSPTSYTTLGTAKREARADVEATIEHLSTKPRRLPRPVFA